MAKNSIHNIIKDRILVLDGAMGTMVQQYNLEEKDFRGERFSDFHKDLMGNNDLLSITRPDIIEAIHKAYLENCKAIYVCHKSNYVCYSANS